MWRECDEKNWSEMNRTNSDFHVALQRKLIFFKVTCCLSLWLLRKPHLKLQHRKKKRKKVQLQWSVEQFGPDKKNSDGKPCESVWVLGICWHICERVGLSGFICQQNWTAFHAVKLFLLLITLASFSHVVCSSSRVFVTHVNFNFN